MRIGPSTRRARLSRRHLLTPSARVGRTKEVARALVGLHATDPPSVVLSARARLREPTLPHINQALYESGELRRMHCMRRTLFVVPADLVPVCHHATAETVAARERASFLRALAATHPERGEAWLAAAQEEALAVLAVQGPEGASLAEVSAQVPKLREKFTQAPGTRQARQQSVGGVVLRLLAMEGRLVRGRQIGGWASGQFRYVAPPSPVPPMGASDAKAELVRHWLATYGPGTTNDVKWWAGMTLTDTRRALGQVGAEEVELDEGVGWVLPGEGDLAQELPDGHEDEPWAALLPTLDPATMGWKDRDFYLDPTYRSLLFDSAGNAGPTVWWNGEIIGAWAQRADGEVVWRLLADRGAQARAAVAAEAASLQAWLSEYGLLGRFTAPLTRELTA